MKIDDIRSYLVLAEVKNFTKASDQLFITQPTLSKAIFRMEEELGFRLLVRDTHGVELTEMGKLAVIKFEQIVEIYDEFLNEVENLKSCESGELKIGMLYYAIDEYISGPVKELREKCPNLQIFLHSYQPNWLIEDLLNDKIDIGLIFDVEFKGSDQLHFHKVCKEKLIVAVSSNNPLASKKVVSISEIRDKPIVMIDDVQKSFQTKFFEEHNFLKNTVTLTEHIDTLKFTLEETKGLTVVASHVRNMNRSNIAFLDIDEEEGCCVDMTFAYKKNNSNPAIPLLLSLVDKSFSKIKFFCVND